MSRFTWVVVLATLASVSCLASEPLQLLIVDQTTGLMESMQVEVLARALLASTTFVIKAVAENADDVGGVGPFDFVIILPHGENVVWVCLPGLPDTLTTTQQEALAVLNASITEVFAGERKPLGPADDLYSFFWSAAFLRWGILQGAATQ